MFRLFLTRSLAGLVLSGCLAAHATEVDIQAQPSDWREITQSGWQGKVVDGGAFDLSGDLVHAFVPRELVETRWLRASASAAPDAENFHVWIHVFDDEWRPISRVLPSTCSVVNDRKVCSNHAWIQPGGSHVRVAFYPADGTPIITPGTIELTSGIEQPRATERFEELAGQIRELYYRTGEVDWRAAIDHAAQPVRRAPANLDPLPTAIGVLIAGLPGNGHTFLFRPDSDATEDANVELPSCVQLTGRLWRLNVPRTPRSEDHSAAYVAEAHACLRHPEARSWLINLTDNLGGDAFLQFAALAPVLGEGPQMQFVNSQMESFIITIEANEVRLGEKVMFSWEEVESANALDARFVIGGRCGSSCEAIAIAVKGRFPTLGQPTAGYATANETVEINDVFSLALTSGVMADINGDVIRKVTPDVLLDDSSLLNLLTTGGSARR